MINLIVFQLPLLIDLSRVTPQKMPLKSSHLQFLNSWILEFWIQATLSAYKCPIINFLSKLKLNGHQTYLTGIYIELKYWKHGSLLNSTWKTTVVGGKLGYDLVIQFSQLTMNTWYYLCLWIIQDQSFLGIVWFI